MPARSAVLRARSGNPRNVPSHFLSIAQQSLLEDNLGSAAFRRVVASEPSEFHHADSDLQYPTADVGARE